METFRRTGTEKEDGDVCTDHGVSKIGPTTSTLACYRPESEKDLWRL